MNEKSERIEDEEVSNRGRFLLSTVKLTCYLSELKLYMYMRNRITR
jgi:hypothetical protein